MPPNRKRRRERGQALVEFALVLPVFLAIVLATVDFGWALRSYITLTNAAREGARLGVTGATACEIKAKTVTSSGGILTDSSCPPGPSSVTVTGAQGASGTTIEVQVDYNHDLITPLGAIVDLLGGGSLPGSLPISTKTVMRLE